MSVKTEENRMRVPSYLAAMLLVAGCAEHRLIVQRPNPTGAPKMVQSNAFAFGTVQRRSVAQCDTNLIDEVRVHQSFGQALVTVVTFGLYMPTKIEYVCANVPSPVGSTDR
jgi:uncharacterized lipoprotein YajG